MEAQDRGLEYGVILPKVLQRDPDASREGPGSRCVKDVLDEGGQWPEQACAPLIARICIVLGHELPPRSHRWVLWTGPYYTR